MSTDSGRMGRGNERSVAADETAASPEQALAGVWDMLDVLPRSAASPALTATTVEMAAVAVRGAGEQRTARGRLVRGWWMPGLAIIGGLGIGIFAGRNTAPDPDVRALEYLPVIRHIAALREAGSVEFLTAVASRNFPPVRRFGPFSRPGDGRSGDSRGADPAPEGGRTGDQPVEKGAAEKAVGEKAVGEKAVGDKTADLPVPAELEAAIVGLQAEPVGRDLPADVLARRRAEVEAAPADDRRRLADRVSEFMTLSEVARYDVLQLARFLADTSNDNAAERERLLGAAAVWHQYVSMRDPAERSDVVDLPAEERLESLDRFYARFQFRGPREWDSRRGFGGQRPPGEAPGPAGGNGAPPGGGGGGPAEPPPGPPRPGGPGFRPGVPGGFRPGSPSALR